MKYQGNSGQKYETILKCVKVICSKLYAFFSRHGVYSLMCVLLTQSLMQHYHHSVAMEAKKLEQPLPKLELDLGAQLDTSVDDVGILSFAVVFYIQNMLHVFPNESMHLRLIL